MTDRLDFRDVPHHIAAHVRRIYRSVRDLLREGQGDPTAGERVERSPGQGGGAPRQIDRTADDLVRKWLLELRIPNLTVRVAGEEAATDDVIDDLPDRTLLFVTDPVDGTSNYLAINRGFSSNIVVYILDRQRFGLRVVATHVWEPVFDQHYWWSDPFATRVGQVDLDVSTDRLLLPSLAQPASDPSTWTIAAVAAKDGPNRDLSNILCTQHKMSSFTFGGAPLIRSLVDQGLTALIETKPTTVYDSAHLLLAAGFELVVGDLDGNVLNLDDLIAMFGRLTRSKDTVVSPYVVADSPDTYSKLCDLIADARKTQRPSS